MMKELKEEIISAIVLNNAGAVLTQEGKYKIAGNYFKKASKIISTVISRQREGAIKEKYAVARNKVRSRNTLKKSMGAISEDSVEESMDGISENISKESMNAIPQNQAKKSIDILPENNVKNSVNVISQNCAKKSTDDIPDFIQCDFSVPFPLELQDDSIGTKRLKKKDSFGKPLFIAQLDDKNKNLDFTLSDSVRVSGRILYNLGLVFHLNAEKKKKSKKLSQTENDGAILHYYKKALEIYERCQIVMSHSIKSGRVVRDKFALLALHNMIYIYHDELHDGVNAQKCLMDLGSMLRVCGEKKQFDKFVNCLHSVEEQKMEEEKKMDTEHKLAVALVAS